MQRDSRTNALVLIVLGTICCGLNLSFAEEPPKQPPMRGLVDLLQAPGVLEDLDVVDFQKEKIDKILAERRNVSGEFGALMQVATLEKRKELLANLQAAISKADSDVAELLLPAQIDRLKQIRFQMLARNDANTYGLKNKKVAEELALTEAQKADIDAKATEVNKNVDEKIKKLKAEIEKIKSGAREELIKILTPEQRKKYAELYGRPFEG
jgi:hypothetical protein